MADFGTMAHIKPAGPANTRLFLLLLRFEELLERLVVGLEIAGRMADADDPDAPDRVSLFHREMSFRTWRLGGWMRPTRDMEKMTWVSEGMGRLNLNPPVP